MDHIISWNILWCFMLKTKWKKISFSSYLSFNEFARVINYALGTEPSFSSFKVLQLMKIFPVMVNPLNQKTDPVLLHIFIFPFTTRSRVWSLSSCIPSPSHGSEFNHSDNVNYTSLKKGLNVTVITEEYNWYQNALSCNILFDVILSRLTGTQMKLLEIICVDFSVMKFCRLW
jgi:hypothetical protein